MSNWGYASAEPKRDTYRRMGNVRSLDCGSVADTAEKLKNNKGEHEKWKENLRNDVKKALGLITSVVLASQY